MSSVVSLAAAADPKSRAFAGVFATVAPHLTELNRFLHEQLAGFEPEIRAMAGDCIGTSVTRIRPALVFLSGWQQSAQIAPDLVRAAAAVELIYLATRLHDDLVDEADVSPSPVVLLGDALFAHGLHLTTQFPTTEICAAITECTRRVCAGKILQALPRRSIEISPSDYRRMVDLKTAEFFRVACYFGAHLAGSDAGYANAASHFGRHLGIAYQIYNDLVDCFGEETRSDYAFGTILANGKLSLPLLALLEHLPPAEADGLRDEIVGEQPPQRARRLRQLREEAIFTVLAELAVAASALREWPDHPATPLLLGVGEVLQAQVAGLQAVGAA